MKYDDLKRIHHQIYHENETLASFECRLYSPPGISAIAGLKLGDPQKVSKLEEIGESAVALDLLIRESIGRSPSIEIARVCIVLITFI